MPFILGATYDESAVLKAQDQPTLERLSGAGFRSLELALHPRALDLGRAGDLVTAGNNSSFSFAFHAPDFVEPSAFDLKHIMAPEGSRSAFRTWMDQCGDLGDEVQLIFHGAPAETDTFRFVDFALEWIEKTRGSQILLLENTYAKDPDKSRYGQTGDELLAMVQAFSGARLGLCLDTAHWLRATHHGAFPKALDIMGDSSARARNTEARTSGIPEPLFSSIRRIHVHGVDPLTECDHQGVTSADQATAYLLSPWISRDEDSFIQVQKNCVLSLEILASSLHETPWLDTVLESGKWLRGL